MDHSNDKEKKREMEALSYKLYGSLVQRVVDFMEECKCNGYVTEDVIVPISRVLSSFIAIIADTAESCDLIKKGSANEYIDVVSVSAKEILKKKERMQENESVH